ncbi:KH domain-containing protein [Spiroplasma platyhelix]|uniref:KH domain-containing protein n=1 Tax=Spiroplasma platyhelix PALS-1 TaxID=1276218 RepID=A0A846U4H4_9MOLU|nr:KH domain-containing protein [Spiroplasma platyhelix]MBE4703984.1 hypothetical protein [Spiroplasma platyhelix PALS-1]NKE38357.1 KH domain-containing protein [Spiroplasma platyhelix PALS-1]UJB29242.1 hypothetical protein SPLAT_v1c04780 [Spiroplasma platyhelix PALS-1]
MYIKIIEQLIEPILLEDIDQVEIREISKNENEVEVIILAPRAFFKKLIGKNGNIIQALSTLVNLKAEMNNQKVKVTVNELS